MLIPTSAPTTGAPEAASTTALSAAYQFNPRLDAARATQRATDEEVPRALSGYRPSITGSAARMEILRLPRERRGAMR